mmetsp:Transcript_11532/g.17185  ORF Transcript_11532/g.17185 Transcript_11532/m.17185 type:complete len:109 (-) Transcript_11532:145-471(-)
MASKASPMSLTTTSGDSNRVVRVNWFGTRVVKAVERVAHDVLLHHVDCDRLVVKAVVAVIFKRSNCHTEILIVSKPPGLGEDYSWQLLPIVQIIQYQFHLTNILFDWL